MLKQDTVRPVNMVTEAFSGAQAPITHVGDHLSGLLPGCHVVPSTTFNLVATGPYLDNRPNCAIVLTARSALQLDNVNFDEVSKAPDPRNNLISQLESIDTHGNPRVTITTIGSRAGPGELYNTNLLDIPASHPSRATVINSART